MPAAQLGTHLDAQERVPMSDEATPAVPTAEPTRSAADLSGVTDAPPVETPPKGEPPKVEPPKPPEPRKLKLKVKN